MVRSAHLLKHLTEVGNVELDQCIHVCTVYERENLQRIFKWIFFFFSSSVCMDDDCYLLFCWQNMLQYSISLVSGEATLQTLLCSCHVKSDGYF